MMLKLLPPAPVLPPLDTPPDITGSVRDIEIERECVPPTTMMLEIANADFERIRQMTHARLSAHLRDIGDLRRFAKWKG